MLAAGAAAVTFQHRINRLMHAVDRICQSFQFRSRIFGDDAADENPFFMQDDLPQRHARRQFLPG